MDGFINQPLYLGRENASKFIRFDVLKFQPWEAWRISTTPKNITSFHTTVKGVKGGYRGGATSL